MNSCYLPVTCRHRTADGTAFYTGGASPSHQYLVTSNSAAISDSLLSFAALALSVSSRPSLCACFGDAIRASQTKSLSGPARP